MPAFSLPRPLIVERARFTTEDRAQIAHSRRPYNRLGFAYQFAFLRLTGRLPRQQPIEILDELLAYVALQLDLDPEEMERYALRQATVAAHAEEIRDYLGDRIFSSREQALLKEFLEREVLHLEQTSRLLARAEEYLRAQKILLPAASALRRLIVEQRAAHRAGLFERMMALVSEDLRVRLDGLLGVGTEGISTLQMLKEPPPATSPRALLKEAAKLSLIEETGMLEVDLSWFNSNLKKTMARRIRHSDGHRIRQLRRGNLWVRGSKRFGKLDDLFLSDEEWKAMRGQFYERSGLPAEPEAAVEHLKQRLDLAYDRFLLGLPKNTLVTVSEGGQWRFASDPAEQLSPDDEQGLALLTEWLKDQTRRVRLPDLLIEVDNELGFTRHFFPEKDLARTAESVCQVIATITAYGCNLGPKTMAQLTSGVSYRQIKRIADWHLHEEILRAALADVVNGISKLDTSQVWGGAKTSSSDGQRFLFPRKTVKRTYSHQLSDYALEFYSFIADNYAPFYTTPIECTERDAAYVLDGLLYHETDIDPEEHYVDTHGYTECNFAAFAMLGKRFFPRIRGLSKQWIYQTNEVRDYGPLEPMLGRRDRRIHLGWIAEHWDRIGQLFASFASGHTTASVALKRLVAFGAKNHFYRATRELGRVFKTEFILEYLSRPELLRRVRQGLLKSEQLHALARSVFYGKLGRADGRDFQRQMATASCLLLILAAIIYWQTKEIERVIGDAGEEELALLRLDLLTHVSPIGWENVTLYGQYEFRRELVRA